MHNRVHFCDLYDVAYFWALRFNCLLRLNISNMYTLPYYSEPEQYQSHKIENKKTAVCVPLYVYIVTFKYRMNYFCFPIIFLPIPNSSLYPSHHSKAYIQYNTSFRPEPTPQPHPNPHRQPHS